MKRFLLLILLLFPGIMHAQYIELKGFGGPMLNSGTGETHYNYRHSKLNGLGGIGASYRARKLEFGLSVSYRRFSFKKTIRTGIFDPLTGFETPGPETTIILKQPAISIAPVFNYHFGKGKLDWYAGLSPAYIRYFDARPSSGLKSILETGGNSFSIEAQVGCSYAVIPGIRCFAALSGGSAGLPYLWAENMRIWTGSLNLGAAFRISGEAAVASGKSRN